MSGGEPSSIKRYVLCAAVSLHTYVSEFFIITPGGPAIMKRRPDIAYFLRMAGRAFDSACISSIIYLFVSYCFARFVLSDTDKLTEITISFGAVLVLIIVMFASAFNMTKASPVFSVYDEQIVNGQFRGFDRASILFRRAMDMMSDSHMAAALNCFRGTDEYKLSERERAVLYFYTGVCYRDMGYPSNGASYFMRSIECGMKHPDALLFAFRCYASAGNIGDAESVFSRLTDNNYHVKYYNFLYTEIGMMYIRADRPDDAIDRFSTGIGLGIDSASSYGGIAISYILKDDMEQSRKYFRKAVLANIRDIEGFRNYYRIIAQNCGHLSEVADIFAGDTGNSEGV